MNFFKTLGHIASSLTGLPFGFNNAPNNNQMQNLSNLGSLFAFAEAQFWNQPFIFPRPLDVFNSILLSTISNPASAAQTPPFNGNNGNNIWGSGGGTSFQQYPQNGFGFGMSQSVQQFSGTPQIAPSASPVQVASSQTSTCDMNMLSHIFQAIRQPIDNFLETLPRATKKNDNNTNARKTESGKYYPGHVPDYNGLTHLIPFSPPTGTDTQPNTHFA